MDCKEQRILENIPIMFLQVINQVKLEVSTIGWFLFRQSHMASFDLRYMKMVHLPIYLVQFRTVH